MDNILIGIIAIIGTIIAYLFAKWVYQRVYTPLLLPVFVATIAIVVVLLLFNVPYETYMIGGDVISAFLGPAVVALAYPLYQHRMILKRLALPILSGTFVGAIIGVLSGGLMAKAIGFDEELIASIIPKSVTTPVAMDISTSLNGIAALAVVFVMLAGIAGAMFYQSIYKVFRMNSTVGRGVGLGSSSHAIGTAKALESSELEGSISTVAMILSAVFVSLLTPMLIVFIL
ncbi:MAG TPA: LrgB family protein [Pseudogracilibacillus sp.]|nr:LrgB family protein [Pseudogracilibacillus sp.]